jgi:cytochrome c oxidase subunit 4
MATATSAANRHEVSHGKAQFYAVWGLLLVATGVEVTLAYMQIAALRMLTILLALSVFKAALIIYYFMHLKYEITLMRRVLMAWVVGCLMLMCLFLPDAFRILQLGVGR